jgi:hypothetical protein
MAEVGAVAVSMEAVAAAFTVVEEEAAVSMEAVEEAFTAVVVVCPAVAAGRTAAGHLVIPREAWALTGEVPAVTRPADIAAGAPTALTVDARMAPTAAGVAVA